MILAAAAAATALAAALLVALPRLTDEHPGYERIGYFAAWNVANRGYLVRDVHTSGAAERLTRLQYAFGNLNADGECYIGDDTDPWSDYQRRFTAEESVSGVADTYEQPLAGNLNQLRQLRAAHPGLRTAVSLGGWNWSRHFSDAALTEESRRAFARSCVDLWLRGNLPVRDGEPQGGEGAAFGVFDGIDLDWEWPATDGNPHNTVRPEDRENYTLLVAELRRRLDELEAETGREYSLTMTFSADPERLAAGLEPEIFDYVDLVSVQGYDLHGSWSDTTNHHAQLHSPDDDPSQARLSVAATVDAYLDHGLPAHKLVVGVPGFGRGWSGVAPGNDGLYQVPSGDAPGGYGAGGESYRVLAEAEGERGVDTEAAAAWLYDGDAFWSFDTPETVALKGAYVAERRLGGLFIWSLEMDSPDAALVRAMDESLPPAVPPVPTPSVLFGSEPPSP
ncbi:chitinase (glycosyl hydrolase family 18) [Allonocardiopsis opalescens]|uniref:chitinase n=2 Tax=Allonocardiopsis opalescens TaxID=1144618 RepID=A0A2T0QFM6_9ACTN|nr:chitinase (glycosyl hydrolase family 18) [Allonocardiopsis opalescens]